MATRKEQREAARADRERIEREMIESHHRPELKPYRSQAEKTALHQRNIQIVLTATNVIVACLTCLKVFGIL